MDRHEQQKEYEALLAANRGLRRRLFLILSILGGIVIVMIAVLLALHFILSGSGEPTPQINFSKPYEGDIFEFEEYLALDRSVMYFDGSVYLSIEPDNRENFDRAVLFLKDFLDTMTRGDVHAYNAAFTVNPHQEPFSQQMIYESVIRYEGYTTDETDKLFVYRLDYKIHRNDGSLRRDVGSDGMIPQWAVVRVTDDGSLSLDLLSTVKP